MFGHDSFRNSLLSGIQSATTNSIIVDMAVGYIIHHFEVTTVAHFCEAVNCSPSALAYS